MPPRQPVEPEHWQLVDQEVTLQRRYKVEEVHMLLPKLRDFNFSISVAYP